MFRFLLSRLSGRLPGALAVAAFLPFPGSLPAATWQGDSGKWTSDHWGMDGGYPGDANHRDTLAKIAWQGGEVVIGEGDAIEMSTTALVSAGDVKQTGGTVVFGGRLDVRGRYILEGGSLSGSSFAVSNGGEIAVRGGELNAPDGEFRFPQELGTLSISGGEFTMRNLFMGDAENGEAVLRVVGSTANMQVWSFWLNPKGGISRAEFVFDKSGVSPWQVRGGGGALKLSAELGAANLAVDVSACPSNGSDSFTLFKYGSPGSLLGAFGEVTVTHGSTAMKPGTQYSLKPGEYYLDLGETGKEIAIFFNNTGLPAAKAATSK